MVKRGMSHIEVILSFFIFIGVVMFALYFFNPAQSSRVVDSSLSYALSELKRNASVEIESFSVILNLTTESDDVAEIELKGAANEADSKKVRVESIGSAAANSEEIAGEKIRFSIIPEFYSGESGKAIVKFSEDFELSAPPAGGSYVQRGAYRIISEGKKKILSEKRILLVNKTYYERYNDLRREFNLPGRTSFGFLAEFGSGEKIECKKDIPRGVEVFSNKERIEVLRLNGRTEFADLTVMVW